MLKQEENVHEILNRIHNKDDVSAIPFPDFLPPKVMLSSLSFHFNLRKSIDLTSTIPCQAILPKGWGMDFGKSYMV
uniref:Uncharacterized protein n=1 Tax=Salix viminalis TaxID=40686 RepID=A0A6N2KS38_SALVM